jgi:toxin ParE1/3/4
LRVRWLRRALRDLLDAHQYVELDNRSTARRLVDQIEAGVLRLPEFPLMGRAGRVAGTRELVIAGTPYLVVYRIGVNRVEILTVIHGARRWPPRTR